MQLHISLRQNAKQIQTIDQLVSPTVTNKTFVTYSIYFSHLQSPIKRKVWKWKTSEMNSRWNPDNWHGRPLQPTVWWAHQHNWRTPDPWVWLDSIQRLLVHLSSADRAMGPPEMLITRESPKEQNEKKCEVLIAVNAKSPRTLKKS